MPLEHYTCLDDHRDDFVRGAGILCYHKIGPRPRKAKLRSLYLPEGLFTRQIRELREAGFESRVLGEMGMVSGISSPRVVLTFDDGSVTAFRRGLPILEKHRFRAIQFLVSGQIGGRNEWDITHGEVPDRLMDEVMVREWIAAGHEIGAHTVTHPRLAEIPVGKAREEITASKKRLEDTFGVPIHHFCYPYGSWNCLLYTSDAADE